MDINTRLDGFIIHPLDAFNDKHQEESSFKFSNTAPHLDGFQVHPLDNFISKEHNNNNHSNNYNYMNNNNYFTNNETYETENTFNTNNNISNYGFDTQIQNLTNTSASVNNDSNYNFNQYDTSYYTSNYNNYNSIDYPVTYTEPKENYNYLNTTTSNVISSNQEPNYVNNYINTSNYSYENYPSTNINYSKILPTKYLPTIDKTNYDNNLYNNLPNLQNSSSAINIKPITFKKINYTNYAIVSPTKNAYSISSYRTTKKRAFTPAPKLNKNLKWKSSTSFQVSTPSYKKSPYKFRHFATNTYNMNKFHHKPALTNYKTYSYVSRPKIYRITTFNPQIKWKNIIPQRSTIIIPTVKRYIIPRRSVYVLPKSQSVIMPNPIVVQPQQSFQVTNIQSQIPQDSRGRIVVNPPILNNLSSNILIPSIPILNQNPLNVNAVEKFPMDNMRSRNRVVTNYNYNLSAPKIYYPRVFERLKKKNF